MSNDTKKDFRITKPVEPDITRETKTIALTAESFVEQAYADMRKPGANPEAIKKNLDRAIDRLRELNNDIKKDTDLFDFSETKSAGTQEHVYNLGEDDLDNKSVAKPVTRDYDLAKYHDMVRLELSSGRMFTSEETEKKTNIAVKDIPDLDEGNDFDGDTIEMG